MAVTVRTYGVNSNNPFWNSDDLLNTLKTALADVGFHGGAVSNTILTFTNSAGTTVAGSKGERFLVKQSSSNNASGNGAVFDVYRNPNTGAVQAVTLVNGGNNYSVSQTLTINGDQIGGANTTDNVTVTVSTVSGAQGNTTNWYDIDTGTPAQWAVCRVENDLTKKMGETYYSFYMVAGTQFSPTLYMRAGPSFQSSTNVFNGVAGLDYYSVNTPNSITQQHYSQVIATSTAVPLTLKTYQSGIDPNFVIFQFSEATTYGKLYRPPFILSNYNSATQPWSLDDCFTGGIYGIHKVPSSSTYEAALYVQLATGPLGKRQAEWGYHGIQSTYAVAEYVNGIYETNYGRRQLLTTTANIPVNFPVIYQRTQNDFVHTNCADYNPVITGLPICHTMVPCPYFMPADFGLTEVVGTNSLEFGDRISVGATTKWEVLQYATNQGTTVPVFTYNSGLAFVAKVVD